MVNIFLPYKGEQENRIQSRTLFLYPFDSCVYPIQILPNKPNRQESRLPLRCFPFIIKV